jgi:Fe-S cluster assembly protein SufD
MSTSVKAQPHSLFQQPLADQVAHQQQHSPQWLNELRQKAFERFETLGLPTKRQEAWKYVDLKPVLNTTYQPFPADAAQAVSAEQAARYFLASHPIRLVFVNGHFAPALSALEAVPPSVRIQPLETALTEATVQVQPLLAQSLATETDAFAALNTALFESGAFLSIPDGVTLDRPVQLLFLTAGRPAGAAYPRTLISLGRGAKASVLAEFVGVTDSATLNSPVFELVVGQDAELEMTTIQNESRQGFHLATSHIALEANARVRFFCTAFGGQVARHNIQARLLGEGADCQLNGLSVLNQSVQVYRHVQVDHLVPNCTSTQLFKGILNDATRSEFDGTIVVHRDAAGTDAQQLNRSLILSDDARVFTRPQLRIDNDDVKCAHGATVGQLEEEELFYLLSRGLNQATAQALLTYGFAEEVIQRIDSEEVRQYLDQLVQDHLSAR